MSSFLDHFVTDPYAGHGISNSTIIFNLRLRSRFEMSSFLDHFVTDPYAGHGISNSTIIFN